MISVIIPIYNRAHTIRRAVDSVLRQTHRDFELILVDDGSTDGSLEICREYERTDRRVKVLHSENRGVSHARNMGLRQASGQYVRFVDSDDELPERSLELLMAPVLADGTIELVAACMDGDVREIPAFPSRPMSRSEFLLHFFGDGSARDLYNVPWNKLYLTSIIKANSLWFDESLRYGEDTHFNFRYYMCIARAYLSSELVYHVHHPPGEPGHLSGEESQNIGDRIRYALMQNGVFRDAAAPIIPDHAGVCSGLLMDALWGGMSLTARHTYPAFNEVICRYDWKKLLAGCRVDSFYWGYKFLYKCLIKGDVRQLFYFSRIKNRLSKLLPHPIKAALHPYITRKKCDLCVSSEGVESNVSASKEYPIRFR